MTVERSLLLLGEDVIISVSVPIRAIFLGYRFCTQNAINEVAHQ